MVIRRTTIGKVDVYLEEWRMSQSLIEGPLKRKHGQVCEVHGCAISGSQRPLRAEDLI